MNNNKNILKILTIVLGLGLWLGSAQAEEKSTPPKSTVFKAEPGKITNLACIGDSITAGVGASKGSSYPDQLGKMLGDKVVVKNFGASGSTLLRKGDNPYGGAHNDFRPVSKFNPDVVIIMLGTNDTKAQNWQFKDQYEADYIYFVKKFQEMPTKPRVYICYPPYIAGAGKYKINETNTVAQIPMIDTVAKETGCSIIDVHGALFKKDELIPDKVHPNTAGATIIAKTVYKALTGKETTLTDSELLVPTPVVQESSKSK